MVYGEKSGNPGMYPSNKVRHVNATTRRGTSPIKSFALQTYARRQSPVFFKDYFLKKGLRYGRAG
jgi:hypothetical protein